MRAMNIICENQQIHPCSHAVEFGQVKFPGIPGAEPHFLSSFFSCTAPGRRQVHFTCGDPCSKESPMSYPTASLPLENVASRLSRTRIDS